VLTLHRLDELAALGKPLHLALGVFDGVHIGHQAVIERAVRAAKEQGGLAGLLTFDPHPIRVIAPGKAPAALLGTLDDKAKVVGGLGVGLFIPLHFDAAMAAMEASEFIARLTAAPVRTIAVGEDWRFGRNRSGDISFLRCEAEKHGFQLEAVPPVMFDGDRISSTRIRQAIHDGNLAEAARMLGRPHSVSGNVVRGEQLGRTLGFPTANIATGKIQLPPDGVWAVRVSDDGGNRWNGVANLGIRPTVGGEKRLLEVHLFGFSGDLYARNLEVRFEKHLRGEIHFPSLEALRHQIGCDALEAREFLEAPDTRFTPPDTNGRGGQGSAG
jgi:riboflavin kinase/FMN adenylyltransferase